MLALLLEGTKMKTTTTKPRSKRKPAKPAKNLGGRPTFDPSGERMKTRHVRTTDAQWERYHEKGGAGAFRLWLESDD